MSEHDTWDDPRYVKPADCDKDGYCVHCGRGAVHRDDCPTQRRMT